jgi:hypothetical protein
MLNSHNKCSIIKNNFISDENFISKKYTGLKINKTLNEILLAFCNSNNENEIILDYRYFKVLSNLNCIHYDSIIQHVVDVIHATIEKKELFIIHVCLKSLSLTDIDKYYHFICKISEILKTTFPDKLDKCFIYKAPFIFSQVFTIVSAFVDKKTLAKIELVN